MIIDEETPTLLKEASFSPEPPEKELSPSPAPEPLKEKSPTPEPVKPRTPTPEPVKEKSPSLSKLCDLNGATKHRGATT